MHSECPFTPTTCQRPPTTLSTLTPRSRCPPLDRSSWFPAAARGTGTTEWLQSSSSWTWRRDGVVWEGMRWVGFVGERRRERVSRQLNKGLGSIAKSSQWSGRISWWIERKQRGETSRNIRHIAVWAGSWGEIEVNFLHSIKCQCYHVRTSDLASCTILRVQGLQFLSHSLS